MYFEINQTDQPFYFEGFDNFDLGIEIKLSNGFHWHIGWKDCDRPEIGIGKFIPQDYHTDYKQIDATSRWPSSIDAAIQDFKLV